MNPPSRRIRAFSLIEMLVAVAVLALLVVMVAQIMTGASKSTNTSRQRLDADSEARMVFDRMADDFANLVNRKDVDFVFDKQPGNDTVFFYSEAPALNPASGTAQPVALIGYRINEDYQLERLGKGLAWDQPPPEGVVFLTYPSTASSTPAPAPASTISGAFASIIQDGENANYHVLGENVFRIEFCFLLKPYTNAAGTQVPAAHSNDPFNEMHESMDGIGLSDVQSVVVTLALADGRSRKVIETVNGSVSGMIGRFSDSVDGTTPAEEWQKEVPHLANAGIPKEAAAQVRVYQRTFFLNPAVD